MKNSSTTLEETFITQGMVVSSTLQGEITLTIGLSLSGISFENKSVLHCNTVENSFLTLLRSLSSDYTLQTRFGKFGSLKSEMKSYYEDTQTSGTQWSKTLRNARLCQLHDEVEAGQIFRSETHLFLSRRLGEQGKYFGAKTAQDLNALLKAEALGFAPAIEQVKLATHQANGTVSVMNDEDLFHEFDMALNPSLSNGSDQGPSLQRFEPASSVLENCLQSEMTISDESECSFCLDGHSHAIFFLKALPGYTWSGLIGLLTNIAIKEISITTISSPLDLESEIEGEEKRAESLDRAASSSKKRRLLTSLNQSHNRIAQLASGEAMPTRFQMILHLWDTDLESLRRTKIPLLKSTITRSGGAKYFLVDNPVMARNAFLSTLPGIMS